jgi:hypothetical protein
VVKAVQGAVYCSSLIKDNVSDAIIKHFGESSVAMLDEITGRCEFDEPWWRAVMDTFVRERIAAGHAGMVAGEKYSVFREGGFVGVRMPFDAVLAALRGTDKAIQKTRVQSASRIWRGRTKRRWWTRWVPSCLQERHRIRGRAGRGAPHGPVAAMDPAGRICRSALPDEYPPAGFLAAMSRSGRRGRLGPGRGHG